MLAPRRKTYALFLPESTPGGQGGPLQKWKEVGLCVGRWKEVKVNCRVTQTRRGTSCDAIYANMYVSLVTYIIREWKRMEGPERNVYIHSGSYL